MFTAKDIERFWSKVDRRGEGECWDWKACLSRNGYGAFVAMGKVHGAHRVSLIIASNKSPPPTVFATHSCDRRVCVNPNHLSWGSASDNFRDMMQRNRRPMGGNRNPAAILSWPEVREIRKLRASGVRAVDLATKFNVSYSTISSIVGRRRWLEE